MRGAVAGVAATGLVALGACGARPPSGGAAGSSDSSGSSPSAGAGGDVACSTMVKAGQEASIDLDGDGSPDHVTYRPQQGGGCAAGLVASVGKERTLTRTQGTPTAMRAVTVPDRAGQILVVSQSHPRGGEQQRLYAFADGKLTELTVNGNPLLPFVATDTPPLPTDGFAAVCTKGGIGVQRVVAHTPVGIAPAFDIVQTDYRIDGTTLAESGSHKVKDNVLDTQLASQASDLAKHQVLTQDCG